MDDVPLPDAVAIFAKVVSRMQEYSGLSSCELLSGVGEQVGRCLSRKMKSNDLNGLLEELAGVRLDLGLGEMDVQKKDPVVVKVYGCTGCVQMPDSEGKTQCPFGEGLLSGVVMGKLGLETVVKLTESVGRGTGYNVCTFVVSMKRKCK
ncbi:MAG: hypothetical protein HYU39_04550 [Thaumarchaeota archaeon]|nr:hypothetical protein [Nitrososphaerota archaeon]